ncbi:response regulator [Streptomyces abikoensis]|uniref:response regulator n=1 Tax=Streptomyces abikoensis TaxID=97398 RepID=UPI003688E033
MAPRAAGIRAELPAATETVGAELREAFTDLLPAAGSGSSPAGRTRRSTSTDVVAEVGTGTEALAAAQRTSPDIALLDVQMPGRDGLTVAADLQRALPGCRTIICTTFSRPGSPAEVPVTEEGARRWWSRPRLTGWSRSWRPGSSRRSALLWPISGVHLGGPRARSPRGGPVAARECRRWGGRHRLLRVGRYHAGDKPVPRGRSGAPVLAALLKGVRESSGPAFASSAGMAGRAA